MENATQSQLTFTSGYSQVNGLKMYYEIYGDGKPLVLIHGGGSTIQTSFGKAIPLFAKNRKVIAVFQGRVSIQSRAAQQDTDGQ